VLVLGWPAEVMESALAFEDLVASRKVAGFALNQHGPALAHVDVH